MSNYTILQQSASSLTIGPAGSAVSIGAREAWQSLRVTLTPRSPVRVRTAAGTTRHIYGPGAAKRQVRIDASGLDVPNLSALDLSSVAVVIAWPSGTTTTVTATLALYQPRTADMHGGGSDWSIEGDEV